MAAKSFSKLSGVIGAAGKVVGVSLFDFKMLSFGLQPEALQKANKAIVKTTKPSLFFGTAVSGSDLILVVIIVFTIHVVILRRVVFFLIEGLLFFRSFRGFLLCGCRLALLRPDLQKSGLVIFINCFDPPTVERFCQHVGVFFGVRKNVVCAE